MICTVEEAKKKKCVFIGMALFTLFGGRNVRLEGENIDTCIADKCMTAWRWMPDYQTVDGKLIGSPEKVLGYCGFGGTPLCRWLKEVI